MGLTGWFRFAGLWQAHVGSIVSLFESLGVLSRGLVAQNSGYVPLMGRQRKKIKYERQDEGHETHLESVLTASPGPLGTNLDHLWVFLGSSWTIMGLS